MRILFSCFPGYGHLHPLLPLARAAQRAGHEVVIATGPGMAGRAAAFGFETWAVGLGQEEIGARLESEFVEVPGRAPMERLRALAPLLFVEIGARPRVGEMLVRMGSWRPDVVVHEYSELSAPVAAARLGVPAVQHGFGPLPPAELLATMTDPLALLALEYGVDSLPPDPLYLDPSPPSLSVPGGAVAPRTAPIGITRSDPAPWEELPAGLSSLPYDETVYVTLGTVVNKRDGALARLLTSVSDLEANVVMTVGPDVDVLQFGPVPDNVLLERWVPQALLLPHCVAMVSHAGAGTMLGGLAAGLAGSARAPGRRPVLQRFGRCGGGRRAGRRVGRRFRGSDFGGHGGRGAAVRRAARRGRAGGDAVAVRGARRGAPRGGVERRSRLTRGRYAVRRPPS